MIQVRILRTGGVDDRLDGLQGPAATLAAFAANKFRQFGDGPLLTTQAQWTAQSEVSSCQTAATWLKIGTDDSTALLRIK